MSAPSTSVKINGGQVLVHKLVSLFQSLDAAPKELFSEDWGHRIADLFTELDNTTIEAMVPGKTLQLCLLLVRKVTGTTWMVVVRPLAGAEPSTGSNAVRHGHIGIIRDQFPWLAFHGMLHCFPVVPWPTYLVEYVGNGHERCKTRAVSSRWPTRQRLPWATPNVSSRKQRDDMGPLTTMQ